MTVMVLLYMLGSVDLLYNDALQFMLPVEVGLFCTAVWKSMPLFLARSFQIVSNIMSFL